MTDLDQRIAALREDHNDPSAWSREAMSIIDEQAAEIERLRARVAELESTVGLSSREVDRLTALILKAHAEDERMDAIAQNGNDGLHYREVGPTPLRGRVTRREE